MSPPHTKIAKEQRTVQPLRSAVQFHCKVCVEEKLFSQALSLLISSLQAGLDTDSPAFLPSSPYFNLFSTLVVHPTYNTRTNNADKKNESNAALRYIRNVVEVVGAGNGTLKNAFRFDGPLRSDRSNRAKTRQADVVDASGESSLDSPYAGLQSVSNRAQDFWAVVGWAFNCSVRHKARWSRWSLWMELMMDILEEDLTRAASCEPDEVADSLFAHYLSPIGEGRNNRRRVMRAITADGTTKSMAEFGEIWKDETNPPKKQDDERAPKRQKLDLEKGQYGDYFDDESEVEDILVQIGGGAAPAGTRRKRRSAGRTDNADARDGTYDMPSDQGCEAAGVEAFGGMESMRLRQRLLVLLARISSDAPHLFAETEDLFDLFAEFFRPLPLDVFQQFVTPQTPYFAPDLQASFNAMLFRPLLGSSTTTGIITQEIFEEQFAANAATNTSLEDNAKVSLLTESLLRALWSTKLLSSDFSRLGNVVEDGINARNDKVSGRKGNAKRSEAEAHARQLLKCSSERLRVLVLVAAS
ncbi:unnamed protein product [Zymoseptoria tritici ST99CH_1A5]|uniref:Uncharacterized protein n=1 Tax=Zymoseptoria tritici ST99CH_1A5 TaxID=1276529 RepID=A0A1Y6LJ74_ZYMTR|nr:unnamed protein product [Zymoseptoria tritici ST99CH_1A5]